MKNMEAHLSQKGVIVYYSWIGNTKMVAEALSRVTGFELMPLVEKKARPLGKVFGAVMGAIFSMKSRLEPVDYALKAYDTVVIGAQVWAGKSTPAINQFLSKGDFSGKKVHIFVTMGDDKIPEKVIASIRNRIEKKGGQVDQILALTTKWDPKVNKPVTLEEVQSEVEGWGNQLKYV